MNILGMGPLEILLIVVLALIVFGPARLPEIMGQVGKAIADFRRTTSELSGEFNRTIQAELQETRAMVDDTKSAVTGVHTSINAAIAGTPAPTLTAPSPAQSLSTPPVNGTNGTHTGDSSPPLADTSQWNWESTAPAPSGPAVTASSAPSSSPDASAGAASAEPAVAAPAWATQTAQTENSNSRDASRDAPAPILSGGGRGVAARKRPGRDDLLPPY